ncbi:hypothetical protein N7456_008494 [Penicillium angulare]|uniref:Uncharacterized protein n=1 Tax=Penicillium angulare TaxID=116970 RepID=A0A9W9FCM1_9EURO|nr:hypothetical protein N7456_008494 [Penicillium angulare]
MNERSYNWYNEGESLAYLKRPEYLCQRHRVAKIRSDKIVANEPPRSVIPEIVVFRNQGRNMWARRTSECKPHYGLENAKNATAVQPRYAILTRCDCTRRANLDLLLVNRQIYQEASYIFWTENWFAFEHPAFLAGLLHALRPGVRALLRKISLINEPCMIPFKLPESLSLKKCWELLRLCTGLKVLEVDQDFLALPDTAPAMRNLNISGRMSFMKHGKVPLPIPDYGNVVIYPFQQARSISDIESVREFAQSLQGNSLSRRNMRILSRDFPRLLGERLEEFAAY